ncbi:MAG TPA: DinB family protein [Jatrophihabitantaceae bacterium]|nr:DinB family protein [Jatrophihabitantaceae bacterium]
MTPRRDIHAELDRVRADFADLIAQGNGESFARSSDGTRWTNRQLLFHMLFGYLIARNLRLIVKFVSHFPARAQRMFAGSLNAASRPFDVINYWGSVVGGRLLTPQRMNAWMGRVITSLHRHLDHEPDIALRRTMRFPSRWDRYFTSEMSLQDVYHYATLHYDHHRAQLTLPG